MAAKKTHILAEPGKQELLITREFDAPRELVFKACTDPKLIPQWWGPRYLSTQVDKHYASHFPSKYHKFQYGLTTSKDPKKRYYLQILILVSQRTFLHKLTATHNQNRPASNPHV